MDRTDSPQTSTPQKRVIWWDAFLNAYRDTGNVRLSAKAAGIDRTTAYAHRNASEAFRLEWDAAREDAADRLEQEAMRRAHDGVRRQKFHQGDPIMVPALGPDGIPLVTDKGDYVLVPYFEHEYSDTLLIFLLKGVRPEKYRENVKVDHGETVRLEIVEEIVDANGPASDSVAPDATRFSS